MCTCAYAIYVYVPLDYFQLVLETIVVRIAAKIY